MACWLGWNVWLCDTASVPAYCLSHHKIRFNRKQRGDSNSQAWAGAHTHKTDCDLQKTWWKTWSCRAAELVNLWVNERNAFGMRRNCQCVCRCVSISIVIRAKNIIKQNIIEFSDSFESFLSENNFQFLLRWRLLFAWLVSKLNFGMYSNDIEWTIF